MNIDWLLNCEPRVAQIEAIARSYYGVKLRTHKDDEINEINFRNGPADGWGHFLEMRLGKTPTLLNEFLLFNRDHGMKRLFILTPNKYKYTWALEIEKFGAIIPVHVFESANRKGAMKFIQSVDEGIMIVNYEALIQETNISVFQEFIIPGSTMIGADESVHLKNRKSNFFMNGNFIAKQCAVSRAMSGKPVVQSVADLWSQMRFIRQLDGINFFQFRNTFCEMGGYMGKKVVGFKNKERLDSLRDSCSFYARREDWGVNFTPDYFTRKIGMTAEQQKAYTEMEDDFITWVQSGTAITADQVITKYIKLAQISSGFVRDEFGEAHELIPFDKSPKFQDLKYILDNEIEGKTIIICNSSYSSTKLFEELSKVTPDRPNPNPAIIVGATTMKQLGKNTDDEKHKFNTNDACTEIICNIRAVKYGHTLIGSPTSKCLTTIYFESSYSLDDMAQSEQRNQGFHQTEGTVIISFAASEQEERIMTALYEKEEIASKIMGYYKGNS